MASDHRRRSSSSLRPATAEYRDRPRQKPSAARHEFPLDREDDSPFRDELLATVSHELRTPLNAILGWTRLLRSSSLDPQMARRALAAIERSALVQTALVDQLLDVSRLATDSLRLDTRRMDLRRVVEAALEALQPLLATTTLRLERQIDDAPLFMIGDPVRLQQVVWNVLNNAIKFTPPEGTVGIALRRAGQRAEMAVWDTGEGIDAAFLPHVFQRFRRAGATTDRFRGSGLGLAIALELIELHHGSITVDSDGLGRGTTVRVRLPLDI